MKEFINNLFKASNERMKNPLIFSFILSWIVFNWKPIFTLFLSDSIIENKINYIALNFSDLSFNLWYPLLFAFGYVIILPYLSIGIELILNKAKITRKRNFIDDQVSDFIGKQAIAKEEKKYENIRAGNAQISELNDKIENLNKTKELQNVELTEKHKQIIKLKGALKEIETYKTDIEVERTSSQNEIIRLKRETSELKASIVALNEKIVVINKTNAKEVNDLVQFVNSKHYDYFIVALENMDVNGTIRFPNSFSQKDISILTMNDLIITNLQIDKNRETKYTLSEKGIYFNNLLSRYESII